MIGPNALELGGSEGLLAALERLPDQRKNHGICHRLAAVGRSQLLRRLPVRPVSQRSASLRRRSAPTCRPVWNATSPDPGCHIAPHEATLRRAIVTVDPDTSDAAVGRLAGWPATHAGRVQARAARIPLCDRSEGLERSDQL